MKLLHNKSFKAHLVNGSTSFNCFMDDPNAILRGRAQLRWDDFMLCWSPGAECIATLAIPFSIKALLPSTTRAFQGQSAGCVMRSACRWGSDAKK